MTPTSFALGNNGVVKIKIPSHNMAPLPSLLHNHHHHHHITTPNFTSHPTAPILILPHCTKIKLKLNILNHTMDLRPISQYTNSHSI